MILWSGVSCLSSNKKVHHKVTDLWTYLRSSRAVISCLTWWNSLAILQCSLYTWTLSLRDTQGGTGCNTSGRCWVSLGSFQGITQNKNIIQVTLCINLDLIFGTALLTKLRLMTLCWIFSIVTHRLFALKNVWGWWKCLSHFSLQRLVLCEQQK